MTAPNMDTVIGRIKKLNAKAESARAIGSEAEAAIFAAKVEELLTKHKLEMSTLSFEELEEQEPLQQEWIWWSQLDIKAANKRRRIAWIERLAAVVAAAHYCKIVVSSGSSAIKLVGRKTDREAAEFVLVTLVRHGADLCAREERKAKYAAWKAGDTSEAYGFKAAWQSGFVNRIAERYREMAEANRAAHGQSYALVVKRSLDEVTKYMKDNMNLRTAGSVKGQSGKGNVGAYDQGRAAGNKANLKANAVQAGQANKQSSVGAGQKRLGRGNG